jgi:hypothetical protein
MNHSSIEHSLEEENRSYNISDHVDTLESCNIVSQRVNDYSKTYCGRQYSEIIPVNKIKFRSLICLKTSN